MDLQYPLPSNSSRDINVAKMLRKIRHFSAKNKPVCRYGPKHEIISSVAASNFIGNSTESSIETIAYDHNAPVNSVICSTDDVNDSDIASSSKHPLKSTHTLRNEQQPCNDLRGIRCGNRISAPNGDPKYSINVVDTVTNDQSSHQQQAMTTTVAPYDSSNGSFNFDKSPCQRFSSPVMVDAVSIHLSNLGNGSVLDPYEARSHLMNVKLCKKNTDYETNLSCNTHVTTAQSNIASASNMDKYHSPPTVPLRGILKKSKSTEDLVNKQRLMRGKLFRFSVGNLYQDALSNRTSDDDPLLRDADEVDIITKHGTGSVEKDHDGSYGFVNFENRRKEYRRKMLFRQKRLKFADMCFSQKNEIEVCNPHSLPNISEIPSSTDNIDRLHVTNSLDPISILTNGAIREIKLPEVLSSKVTCSLKSIPKESDENIALKCVVDHSSNRRTALKLSGIKTCLPKLLAPLTEIEKVVEPQMTFIAHEIKPHVSTNSIKRNLSCSRSPSALSEVSQSSIFHKEKTFESSRLRRFDRPSLPTTVPGGRKRIGRTHGPVISSIIKKNGVDKGAGSDDLKRTIYYMSDIIDKQCNLEAINNRKNSSTGDLSYLSLHENKHEQNNRYQSLSDLRTNLINEVNMDTRRLSHDSHSNNEYSAYPDNNRRNMSNHHNNIMVRNQINRHSTSIASSHSSSISDFVSLNAPLSINDCVKTYLENLDSEEVLISSSDVYMVNCSHDEVEEQIDFQEPSHNLGGCVNDKQLSASVDQLCECLATPLSLDDR